MNNLRSRVAWCLVAGLCSGGAIFAQQSSSTLKGSVRDAGTGNPKPGVRVTISNPSTGLARSVITDAKGLFVFPFVPVGPYQLTYSFGNQTYKANRSALLGQEVDASFKWPATAGVTVEVIGATATAQSIDTTSAQTGTAVTVETLANLPIASRDINAAAVLAPGVSIVSGSNVDPTKKSSSYIMTGEGMGRGTNYAVDGADNNSTDVGGYVLPVPFDAVQELQVVTNQFKAEFGRSTQGFFNILTKGGTNNFEGIVSGQYQNQSMRARRTDEGTKKDDNQNSIAATITGPIVKDKLFFMISTEQTKGSAVAFDFSTYATTLDPRLNGIKYELTKKNIYSKIDWNPTQKINTSFTYGYYQDETANQPFPRTSTFNGNVLATSLGTGRNKTWAAGGKITFLITDSLVWESNFRYFDYKNGIQPYDQGPGNGSPMDIQDISTTNNPRLDQNNLGFGGIDPNALQNTGIKRTQWKNDVNSTFGDHNFKVGFEYMRTTYADQVLFFGETGLRGFTVGGLTTTGAVANYANSYQNILRANENVTGIRFVAKGTQDGISFNQYGLYLQDDWTVSPNLSIYLGLRTDWDTQLDYLKQYDNMYAQIRANTLAADPTSDPAFTNGRAPRGKNYISPRFQATYRPYGDDKLALKFGAGRFVAQVIDNVTGFSRSLNNRVNGLPARARNNAARVFQGDAPTTSFPVASFLAGSIIGSVNGNNIVLPADLTPYNYANNINGLRDYFRNTVDGWLTKATANTDGKSLLASDFQYPVTTTINAGVAYRLSERQAVELNLIYSKTKHLSSEIAGLDGSGPRVTEYDSGGDAIGDSVFYSNQSASSIQLQAKYTYSNSNTSILATLTVKNQKSSEGGAAGAFDASGNTGGLYGEGARYAWQESPERRSPGSERYSGSFTVSHRFGFGTILSVLGQWHSGRAYDVIQAYNYVLGPGATVDQYHPQEVLGYEEGRWAMNMDFKVSHKFKFGKNLTAEPYITIQNILNNYDYGANFDGTKYLNDGTYNGGTGNNDGFGTRLPSYQSNSPRTGVVGVKLTF